MNRQIPPFALRMPDELKAGLRNLAEQQRRSMNAQIVTMLEDAMQAEKTASGQP